THAQLALRRARCPEAAAPGTLRQARFAKLCGRCCAFGAVPLHAERCPKQPPSVPPSAERRAPICADLRRSVPSAEHRA
ncbi:hypothetical protein T492DRAFT_927823, partial [Pavlovales sp. CCMP2436]